MSPLFSSAALRTILNNAPLILQGADKLIRMIRSNNMPITVEGLKQGVERLEQRLDADAQADIEQIKLIEELARQNEALAESLKRSYLRLNYLTVLSVAALLVAVAGFIIIIGRT